MYPLTLQAKPGAWQRAVRRKSDKAFEPFRDKVFTRDKYTCKFCGFQAKEFQEVINLDNNYSNNKTSNLVTSCCFCAQCFFLESVGLGDYGGGTLIYLPEIKQPQLNGLCHVLFCAITNDTGYKQTAQSIYRTLKYRSQIVEEKFGEGSSNPSVFGQLLVDTGVAETDSGQKVLSNLRLLPSRVKFRKQIERWAASALDELSSDF